jgi:DNA end-binding protein Ku
VRTPDFTFLHEDPPQVRSQEMAMATSLIDSLSEPVFESDKYSDSYREALEELIESKVAGGDATTKPDKAEDSGEVVDLMDALKASVSAARKNRPASKKTASEDKADDEETEAKPAKKTPTRRPRKSA